MRTKKGIETHETLLETKGVAAFRVSLHLHLRHRCPVLFTRQKHRPLCEGGGDVVGVVTPLVGGVAQAFHGDQVVELRVQLAVQEVEGKEEDREGQVEVEEEKRLKEVRTWVTMEMK